MSVTLRSDISLLELQQKLKTAVELSCPRGVWVRAEINGISVRSNGHCYMDLVQKEESGTDLVAQARATVWANTWRLLDSYFKAETGVALREGLQVLVFALPQLHPVFGLSLNVTDIDPAYTLGAVEQQRMHTIRRLQQDGIWDMNRSLPLPDLPMRVAVISSATAAGYGDFCKHLQQSGYAISFRLFPALVQGAQAPASICAALDAIDPGAYDVAVLIRGGGSRADLSCFDDYELCFTLAQFPLPVLTGIGHDQDEHIADMVAALSCKTPTAVADYLIGLMQDQGRLVQDLENRLALAVHRLLNGEKLRIEHYHERMNRAVKERLGGESLRLERWRERIGYAVKARLQREHHALDLYEQRIKDNNPLAVMSRGFAIVTRNGHCVKDAGAVKKGEQVEILWQEGRALAEIKDINIK